MHFNQSEPHPPDVADLTFNVALNSLLLLSRELHEKSGRRTSEAEVLSHVGEEDAKFTKMI